MMDDSEEISEAEFATLPGLVPEPPADSSADDAPIREPPLLRASLARDTGMAACPPALGNLLVAVDIDIALCA